MTTRQQLSQVEEALDGAGVRFVASVKKFKLRHRAVEWFDLLAIAPQLTLSELKAVAEEKRGGVSAGIR